MSKFLFIIFALSSVMFGYRYFEHDQFNQTLIARVTLKTNCKLEPSAFSIKNINSGEIREFQHGEAFIKAKLTDHLMVVMSEKYEQVSFEGDVIKVKQKLEIFQDCDQPIGLAGIFKSFNEQFSSQ